MENEETKEKIDKLINENEDNNEFFEHDKLTENNIVKEIEDSFLDYSMSVITARALPDLRDGLKPVNRRILWSMYESGTTFDKPHRKSATTVGEVMGKYHPHGDSSIYEAMVRMAQTFSYRYTLVDGHGNFGNIDGDGAAAMRYTEARLSKVSNEMLRDINKDTIDFIYNFDETQQEPTVLPSRFPNILVNGTMGIAVGMATNIPPHNLGEVIDGCVAYIDNPEIDALGLMQYIKGPDFPTGGVILGNSGIKKAYETGKGTITIRSKAHIEEDKNHSYIIIEEVPYGVNTKELQNRVAELVKNKVLDGISDYHTDLKNGIKITITLKRDVNAQVILNNLYKHTDFQTNFGIIFLMIDNGIPRTLPLKDIIAKYIDYQKAIIIRRTKFDLNKDEKRVHILKGYIIAHDNIDEVVKIIKEAETDVIAKEKLMSKFSLDEVQTEAILELKLRRLTGLETNKINEELDNLLKEIKELQEILASESKVLEIIKKEMLEIKAKYSDPRRTSIDMTAVDYIEDESLIPEENIMVSLTNKGYIKRTTADTFKIQNRGGVGIKGMTTNEEDFVKELINLSTHDYLLFFTNKGKVYRLKGYEVPEYSRQAKGLPIINLIPIEQGEFVNNIISINKDENASSLLFVTKNGIVKKTNVSEFENIRQTGKICITLKPNDDLIAVRKITGNNIVLLASSDGRLAKFNENEIRNLGRTASGVIGITLNPDATCVSADVSAEDDKILILTDKGYGKQTFVKEFRETKRGSKGVKALNSTDKNGNLCTVSIVGNKTDIVIITDGGTVIRMPLNQITTLGRITQGVRLINLKDNQKVSSASLIISDEENTEDSIKEDI